MNIRKNTINIKKFCENVTLLRGVLQWSTQSYAVFCINNHYLGIRVHLLTTEGIGNHSHDHQDRTPVSSHEAAKNIQLPRASFLRSGSCRPAQRSGNGGASSKRPAQLAPVPTLKTCTTSTLGREQPQEGRHPPPARRAPARTSTSTDPER